MSKERNRKIRLIDSHKVLIQIEQERSGVVRRGPFFGSERQLGAADNSDPACDDDGDYRYHNLLMRSLGTWSMSSSPAPRNRRKGWHKETAFLAHLCRKKVQVTCRQPGAAITK